MGLSQNFFVIAMLASLASAAPLASYYMLVSNSSGFSQQQNGLDAQKLNAQFATISANDSCTSRFFNNIFCFHPSIVFVTVPQVERRHALAVPLHSALEAPGRSRLARPVCLASPFLSLPKLAPVSLVTHKVMLKHGLSLLAFREG
jgi:hypothetical protein